VNFILTGWKGYESGITISYEWCKCVAKERSGAMVGKETHDFKVTPFIRSVLWTIKRAAKMKG
jgi:hypothetical protein